MLLYLVRHGQSQGNLSRTLHGQTDYPLTELGREQARKSAEKLRGVTFERCVSSDLIRARDTAMICLEGRDIPLETMPALRESFVGEFEDMEYAEAEVRYPNELKAFMTDWFHNIAPGGERTEEFMARVKGAAEELIADGRDTLVVAHNGSLTMLLYALGLADEEVLMRPVTIMGQGTVSTVEILGGHARLVGFNQ